MTEQGELVQRKKVAICMMLDAEEAHVCSQPATSGAWAYSTSSKIALIPRSIQCSRG